MFAIGRSMFSNVAAPRFTSLVRPTAPRAFLLPLLRREYRVAASDLRAKHLIDHDGKKLEVVDMHAAMMGRRPTSIHIDARDLATGKVFKFRFNTGDKVERIMLDSQEYEFLYREGEVAYLMHPVTFEQMEVPASLFGSQLPYLLPNSKVTLNTSEGKIFSAEAPEFAEVVVKETAAYDPSKKLANDATDMKEATLDNGRKILVPHYLNPGDKIKIRTTNETFHSNLRS